MTPFDFGIEIDIGHIPGSGAEGGGILQLAPTIFDFHAKTEANVALINGSLSLSAIGDGANYAFVRTLNPYAAGKYYFEVTINEILAINTTNFGFVNASANTNNYIGVDVNSIGFFDNGEILTNGANFVNVASATLGSVVGIAFDAAHKLMWFRTNNGNWNANASANPVTNAGGISFSSVGGAIYPAISVNPSVNTGFIGTTILTANFGQTNFNTSPPTGFANVQSSPTSFDLPTPARTAGYTSAKFFDHFTSPSTIDLTNSQAPGFKWYIRQDWPSAVLPGNSGWAGIQNTNIVNASIFIVANSVLEISNSNSFVTNPLASACALGANGTSYVGTAIAANQGFYAETRMWSNNALANKASVNWPICWMVDVLFLTGFHDHHVEVDIAEMFPTGTGTQTPDYGLHDWYMAANTQNSAVELFPTMNTSNWHVFGFLYVPGSPSSFNFYMDGLLIQTTTFSPGTGSSPNATPNNAIGTFAEFSNSSYMTFLSGGQNWPAYYDYFGIWQAP